MSELDSAAPPRITTLSRNFVWALAGNVGVTASQWWTLAAIAKLGTAEDVGSYALALAYVSPVFMFTNLQLGALLVSYAGLDVIDDRTFVRLRAVGSIGALVTVALIGSLMKADLALPIAVLGLVKLVEAQMDLCWARLQRDENLRAMSIGLLLYGVISAAAATSIYAASQSLILAFLGMFGAGIAVWRLYGLRRVRASGASVYTGSAPWSEVAHLARRALPLGIAMLLISINGNLPRYFLDSYDSRHEVAVFAALQYMIVAIAMLAGALGNSAAPRLARLFNEHRMRDFGRLVWQLVLVGLLVGLLVLVITSTVGASIVRLAYSPEYANRVEILIILAAGVPITFATTFLGVAMTAAKRLKIQVPFLLGTTLACSGLCWRLVPEYGAEGASVAVVLASLVPFFGSTVVLLRLRTRPHG